MPDVMIRSPIDKHVINRHLPRRGISTSSHYAPEKDHVADHHDEYARSLQDHHIHSSKECEGKQNVREAGNDVEEWFKEESDRSCDSQQQRTRYWLLAFWALRRCWKTSMITQQIIQIDDNKKQQASCNSKYAQGGNDTTPLSDRVFSEYSKVQQPPLVGILYLWRGHKNMNYLCFSYTKNLQLPESWAYS